jgi:hypothetical protein
MIGCIFIVESIDLVKLKLDNIELNKNNKTN